MGLRNHECIIATTWDDDTAEKIKEWVSHIPLSEQELFAFIPSLRNGYTTIFFGPDGSKKGWSISEEIEKRRDEFVNFLGDFSYADGNSPVEWVEVGYGEFGQKVLRGNCKNLRNEKEYATDE